MARNGAGSYTLPSAAFVPDTLLTPAGPNSDFADIATAITGTIAADGQTTMSGPLVHENGVATLPSVTFAGDKTTGVYLIGTAMMGFTVGGSLIWSLSETGGLTVPIEQQANGAQILPAGTSAQRPLITEGSWRWNTSTGQLEVFDGLAWVAISGQTELAINLNGYGSTLTSGVKGVLGPIPYAITLNQVELFANASGSIEVDIWAGTYSVYPFTSGSSITGSDKPTLSNAQSFKDTVLTGWTTSLSAGTILMFNVVTNATGINSVRVALQGKKT